MKDFIKLIVVTLLFLVSGCSRPDSLPAAEYEKWILSSESGFYKSKEVNDVDIAARFVPAQYLAYREFRNREDASYDTLLKSYECGLAFQIVLQADRQHPNYGNLMFYGLDEAQDISDRTRYLNFNVAEFVSLTFAKETFHPVLANFEGYNNIANQISFQIVFDIPQYECGSFRSDVEDITLTFSDPVWGLGVNNFLFEKKDMESVPKLEY
jgi:hypothetical protein